MSATRKIPKKTAETSVDFEKSLTQLNQIIEKMESGQLSLESSLGYFEKGVGLIRQCQDVLNHAEKKIQMITEKAGKSTLVDFESEND